MFEDHDKRVEKMRADFKRSQRRAFMLSLIALPVMIALFLVIVVAVCIIIRYFFFGGI